MRFPLLGGLLLWSLGCTPAQVARPSGRIRVLNLFTVDGGPGPTVDVYPAPAHAGDAFDTRTLPLIAGVEYAKLSDPISPPANDNVGVMSFFLEGKKTATPYYPGEPVPGHFELDDRAVLLLRNCPDAGTAVCFDTLFEGGSQEAEHPLPTPDGGMAMFYEASAALTANTPGKTFWWGIGGTCVTRQDNGELDAFEVPAASYNLRLILKNSGETATCMEVPAFSLPVSTIAGRRAWLFMWGNSASDIHASWASFL